MMKICLVNVSDVDEAMRSRLRVWRNSEKVSPFFLLDQVTEEQHRAWLERNVRGEDARACVIYADQVPLGLVYLPWFDRNTDKTHALMKTHGSRIVLQNPGI